MMRLTSDIHLKYADGVFRVYIKSLGDRAVDRGEESVSMNAPIHEALESIRNPYERLEKKMTVNRNSKKIRCFTGWACRKNERHPFLICDLSPQGGNLVT